VCDNLPQESSTRVINRFSGGFGGDVEGRNENNETDPDGTVLERAGRTGLPFEWFWFWGSEPILVSYF